MKTVREHLELNDGLLKGKSPVITLLLEHGRKFSSAALPEGVERGPKKNCFENALNTCYAHPALDYAEGYAASADLGVPLEHGWCVDPYGNVVDPTWDDPEDGEYFGVSVPFRVAGEIVFGIGYYGILGNLWRARGDDDGILATIRNHNGEERIAA